VFEKHVVKGREETVIEESFMPLIKGSDDFRDRKLPFFA